MYLITAVLAVTVTQLCDDDPLASAKLSVGSVTSDWDLRTTALDDAVAAAVREVREAIDAAPDPATTPRPAPDSAATGEEPAEWLIPLPTEGDELLDRALEARDREGTALTRWRYNGNGWTRTDGRSIGPVGIAGFSDLFEEIVSAAMAADLVLVSVPGAEPPR